MASTTVNGRKVAERERRRIQSQGGLAEHELRNCQDPGPDGTSLPDCVKIYLGPPTKHGGPNFRMIFMRVNEGLMMVAFGVAHMPSGAVHGTVYKTAHDRING